MIYKKLIIDIETNRVLEAYSVDYTGPVVECKGPKIKMAAPPPPSAEEKEMQRLSLFATKRALYEQGYDPETLQPRELTASEKQEKEIDDLVQRRFLDELNRKPGEVSPDQEKALNELYGAEQSKADEELQRFMVEQAGARGLNTTDTPLARELIRGKQQSQTQLGAARASSKLNFADRERLFAQGMQDWRTELNQRKLTNLMGTGGQASQTAIGFMNARGNLKPSPYSSGGGGNVGGIVSGIGSAVGGVAMAF